MTDEIKIWAVDNDSKGVAPVPPIHGMETEISLEDLLVENPDMLMPGLTLVGRQTPTESGCCLDLLGVDESGQLILFELKRGKLTREAVAQAIDYGSCLESLEADELAERISKCSGSNGIAEIADFEEWYGERYPYRDMTELRPVKMVLVGFGFDTAAQRMVRFLSSNGVDISLFSFHGYQYGNRTLLARHAEESEARGVGAASKQPSAVELRRRHEGQAEKLGIGRLWNEVVEKLSVVARREKVKQSGITFHMPAINIDGSNSSASSSVILEQGVQRLRLTFSPFSVHLCFDKFTEARQTVPFETRTPPNVPPTGKVPEEWYCLLGDQEWTDHGSTLHDLAVAVSKAWKEKSGADEVSSP